GGGSSVMRDGFTGKAMVYGLPLALAGLMACGTPAPQPDANGAKEGDDVRALIADNNDSGGANASTQLAKGDTAGTDQGVSGQTRYSVALNYYDSGDAKAALRELEKCTKEFPNYTDAWYLTGMCQLKLGDSAAAQATFQKVIEIDPKYSQAHNALG